MNARFFPEVGAGGFSRIDSTIQFYQRVNSLLHRDFVVFDFGAGRGAAHIDDPVPYRHELLCLKGKVRKIIGADVDPIVETNPVIDERIVLGSEGHIPLADRSIDMVISDFTFEHIGDPQKVASELDRILVPGGWICARTPNRYGYIAIANRLVPNNIRRQILRLAQPDRNDEDVFPAVYRLNTPGTLRHYFDPSRYDHFVYPWDAEPAYHAGSAILYRLFLIVHAVTPNICKTLLLIFLRKKRG
jgi:SAM-dependent methyltransferase